eukprot:TRINITY_DN2053_c0_g1_i12.p1 TRINITY_DN2053_c0_g1~~TRINITY_DN2053_c0_g1_i12.p1  ORF type:complete len:340 (+),score=117.88 TRINITY_DN2053_c0_g1_i12:50-1021(+)
MATVIKKDKRYVNCEGCGKNLESNSNYIACRSDHRVCKNCTPNFLSTIFEDENNYIEIGTGIVHLKCITCKTPIDKEQFQSKLNEDQKKVFEEKLFLSNLIEGDHVECCPFCKCNTCVSNDYSLVIFNCGSCQKIHCRLCKEEITLNNESKHIYDQNNCYLHFELFQTINSIILNASQRNCPNCKFQARKNNLCNEIKCPKCKDIWCYCCGLNQKQFRKSQLNESYISHFFNWKTNPNCCPNYLQEFHSIEPKFNDCANQSLNLFHEQLVLFKLKSFFQQNPNAIEQIKRLQLILPNILQGFKIEDILNFQLLDCLKKSNFDI